MEDITLVFTKTLWNPLSWFIRWLLPRNRFALALSSHVYVVYNDEEYVEAVFPKGVQKVKKEKALKGLKVVKTKTYKVPNKEAGMQFLQEQIGKKYDTKAAIGLGLDQDRDWNDDEKWYCYELAAGVLRASGLKIFSDLSHVTETALLAIDTE